MAAAAIPLILSGISGLAGLFGGGPKTTTQTTNSNGSTNSNTSGSSTTTPDLSGLQTLLSNTAGYDALNKYNSNSSTSLIDNIKTSGLQGINQGANNQQQITANLLAQRGLAYSPYAAGVLGNVGQQKVSQQNSLIQSLPVLKQQFDDSNFQNLLSAFKALPTGSTTTGSSSTSGNSTGSQTTTGVSPNNSVAGALSGVGSALAAPTSSSSGLSAILQSLGIGNTPPGGFYGVNTNGGS